MGCSLHHSMALIVYILVMKPQQFLLLLAGVATLSIGCGGGGECTTAFDKDLECGDHSDKRKKKMKSQRSEAISYCKKNKDKPRMQSAITCGKTNSCEEYTACKLAEDSKSDIEEIETKLKEGKAKDAMSTCRYQLDTYKAVPDFKAACDKAFAAVFADLNTEDTRRDARYTCASASDADEWRAASPALTAGCKTLSEVYKTTITKQRDTGSEYNYGDCTGYSDLLKAIDKDGIAAATLLCNEADIADDFAEGFTEITKNVAEKKASLPFRCTSILDPKYNADTVEKLKDSKWFSAKSIELAKACYGGEMGTLLLGKVTSYCGSTAKLVHAAVVTYKLPTDDAAFKAALDSTAEKCSK